jgi:hypothetical protein
MTASMQLASESTLSPLHLAHLSMSIATITPGGHLDHQIRLNIRLAKRLIKGWCSSRGIGMHVTHTHTTAPATARSNARSNVMRARMRRGRQCILVRIRASDPRFARCTKYTRGQQLVVREGMRQGVVYRERACVPVTARCRCSNCSILGACTRLPV